MAHLKIDLRPYTGEYPIDLDGEPFTTLEWRWIKQLSGYLPLTVEQGFAGLDPDLFVALAVIALHRNGKILRADVPRVAERLADEPFNGTAIMYVGDDDGSADDPPAEAEPETTSPSASGGPSSTPPSDPSDELPRATGALA